jgi:protein-S-isoprenylcysteine O-methyltransferase Ste14
MLLLLVLVPLLIRHAHHFWVTRHAQRRWRRAGLGSAVVWAFCYVILAVGALNEARGRDADVLWWVGYVLLCGAVAGRMIAIRPLAAAFSELIRVDKDQSLVKSGIYARIRHPLHYFLWLEMAAMAMLWGSGWGWLLVLLAFGTLLLREVREEEALVMAYGEEYLAYRRQAIALIDLFCKGRVTVSKDGMENHDR